jgi:AAA+ superfamily predicted ATPase
MKINITFMEKKQEQEPRKEGEKGQERQDTMVSFVPIQPRYTFSQLIIPDSVREEIMTALSVIKNKKLIYDDWGFGQVEPNPRSILNFYGEPGTGKSMCAHAIASELGKSLLALNYADIESKYVGEAAKNLKKAFDTAKETDAVMFFDEADSFLGKRIENVTAGSDQALNSLRSQMLIYLEEFTGVVLFATNLVTNFDRAFESRILNHIKFELPNKEARAAIIEKMIPAKLPKDKEFCMEDYLAISDLIDGLSGREIKTAIQSMLLAEAQKKGADAVFTTELLKDALVKKKE